MKGLTDSKALNIGDLMVRQLDALRSLSLSRGLRDRLILANSSYGTDPEGIQTRLGELDQEWATSEDDTDFLPQSRLRNAVATELIVFRESFPDHIEIVLTDVHGGILAATDRPINYDQSNETWWQAAFNSSEGSAYISLPVLDESRDTLKLNIALPVYDNGMVIGILQSTYRLTTLGDIITSAETAQQGVRADILFPNGQIASSGDVILKPIEPIVLEHLEEMTTEPYKEFIFEGVPNFASQTPITSFTNDPVIADLGWIFIVHQNRQEALAAVEEQERNIILLAIVIAGVAVIVAIGMTQLLTRPIVRLTNVARTGSTGELGCYG